VGRAAGARKLVSRERLIYRETLWSPLGMEKDADMGQSRRRTGTSEAGSGARWRDYARLAAFVLDDGVVDGKRLRAISGFAKRARARECGKKINYGYFWVADPEGDPVTTAHSEPEESLDRTCTSIPLNDW